jgi:hypothetical protein
MWPLILALALALVPVLSVDPAAADTPPQQITKRLFRELVQGQHPLGDFIDPAHGVVVVDWPGDDWDRVQPERARHLCNDELGAGLPLTMFDLLDLLGWRQDIEVLSCTNRPTPSCTVGKDKKVFRVEFRVAPPRGLVIESIVRVVGYRPLTDDARAARLRTAAAHVMTARTAGCPATTRVRPTALTKRYLRELAWGLRPMSEVIDPRRGLVRTIASDCAAEDCTPGLHRHLCGAELNLEEIRRGLLRIVANEADGSLMCQNAPIRLCVGNEAVDMWSSWDHLLFVDDPDRGLVLVSWGEMDLSMSDESQRNQRRWAQHRADKTCAPLQ